MIWHNEPPPKPGWYTASLYRDPQFLRFWSGKEWSVSAPKRWTPEGRAPMAERPAGEQDQRLIEWSAG